MRILYLHQYFITPSMPGGTRSYEMARRLVAAGHQVDMITSDQSGQHGRGWRVTDEAGIRVHWISVPYDNKMSRLQRIGAFVTFAWRATWRAVRLGGDVIFATSTPLTISIPAMIASFLRRRPFVFEVRDQWPDVPIAIGAIRGAVPIALARGLERLTYARADHIVALAPGMAEDIIAKGVDPAKVSVIPNGCDMNVFGATPGGDGALRGSIPWLGERPLVTFAGTFGEVTGVGYLVALAVAVRALDPEVRFALFGGGREVEPIREAARAAGILDETFFLFPPQPKDRIAEWLAVSNVSVALFRGPRVIWKDAVQNKFFDAVAAGCAVACNFDGWQTRVAVEADIGFELDSSDIEAAARTLVGRIRDREWMRGVPERARALAAARFDRDLLARQLLGVLEAAAH